MVVSQGGRDESSLYLTRALAIGTAPKFDMTMQSPEALAGDTLTRSRVLILNDVAVSESMATRLVAFVEGGGGLWLSLGSRATWPAARAAWLPVAMGNVVDRTRGAAAKLSAIDYGHQIFEPFRAPRSGDFASARFYSYRAHGGGQGRHRARAIRYGRAGAGRARAGPRACRRLCLHARPGLERPRAQARVPAVRAPDFAASGELSRAAAVADRRPGARRHRRRSGGGRDDRGLGVGAARTVLSPSGQRRDLVPSLGRTAAPAAGPTPVAFGRARAGRTGLLRDSRARAAKRVP